MLTSQQEKGRQLCERLHGKHSSDAIVGRCKICPDYINMRMEWSYGGTTGRPTLPIETRGLLLLACVVCQGEYLRKPKGYAEAAVGLGISKRRNH